MCLVRNVRSVYVWCCKNNQEIIKDVCVWWDKVDGRAVPKKIMQAKISEGKNEDVESDMREEKVK